MDHLRDDILEVSGDIFGLEDEKYHLKDDLLHVKDVVFELKPENEHLRDDIMIRTRGYF